MKMGKGKKIQSIHKCKRLCNYYRSDIKYCVKLQAMANIKQCCLSIFKTRAELAPRQPDCSLCWCVPWHCLAVVTMNGVQGMGVV